jgi:glycosyltransferase involved in cell wall biosynthesis
MVLYNAGLTGGPRISRSLARSFKDSTAIRVLVPSEEETALWLSALGIETRVVPRERLRAALSPLQQLKYLLKLPGMVGAYRRAIQEFRPDIIHIDCLLNVPALIAAGRSPAGTLLHVQEIPSRLAIQLLGRIAGRCADRIVAISRATAAPLGGYVERNKLAVVYNGAESCVNVPDYNPDGCVLFSGRLSADKDPISFVRAARLVYEQYPEARFMICGLTVPGRARYEAKLAKEIAEAKLSPDNLAVLRDQPDMKPLLAQASMVVSCSAAPEPFGQAVLEGMAAGKPVVVPNAGGLPEFVTDGITGLIYPPGDTEAMARCVLRLLREPALAAKLGRAAHSLAREKFTERHMALAMKKEYARLLHLKRNRQARPFIDTRQN